MDDFRNFAEIQYITGGPRKIFYQIHELQSQGPDSIHLRSGIVKVSEKAMSILVKQKRYAEICRKPRRRSGTEFN